MKTTIFLILTLLLSCNRAADSDLKKLNRNMEQIIDSYQSYFTTFYEVLKEKQYIIDSLEKQIELSGQKMITWVKIDIDSTCQYFIWPSVRVESHYSYKIIKP